MFSLNLAHKFQFINTLIFTNPHKQSNGILFHKGITTFTKLHVIAPTFKTQHYTEKPI